MASRFKQLQLAEFIDLLNRFPFTRRVNAVHMHHTWRPNRAQYRGLASIEAMWRYHTQTNGWSDIAQHITIAPDGTIWTGRNWNQAPASASGHNGNSLIGPFMFEMIGDFDRGKDPFDGAQRNTALHVVAHVLHHFGLPAQGLHFHREMSTKTCPGSGIDYAKTLADVKDIMAQLAARPGASRSAASPADAALLALLHPEAAEPATRAAPTGGYDEPAEEQMPAADVAQLTSRPAHRSLAPDALPPATVELLRAHVVNLDQGQFSADGQFSTSPADVDAIFGWRLEQALREATAAQRPLQLLFYAHGGLVSERTGLQSAARYIPWWRQNHVYPIYFVWETGLMGTLGALLRGQRRRAAGTRGFTDWTDQVVETAVRAPGRPIWKNMKDSAAWAAAPDGGSHYVARQLLEFCRRHPREVADGQIRLHAVGHSAGSIFHAHFLPLAWQLGVPGFRTLHLLAPAIRADEFQNRLAPHIGSNVGQLTLYTMRDTLERDDTCAGVYRKSLLYLVHRALETERDTPILGLDVVLRSDAALRSLLGLDGQPSPVARVVWSQTKEASGRSSSYSTTHGGFDDDAATMESVARRVLDQDHLVAFPQSRAVGGALDPWSEPIELPADLLWLAQEQLAQQQLTGRPGQPWPAVPPAGPNVAPPPPDTPGNDSDDFDSVGESAPPKPKPRPASRRALCIGIDHYPDAPLRGCVADAKAWQEALSGMGFETQQLINSQATRDAILQRLHGLITSSQAGDILVLQFAGHGTQVPDTDGDERSDEYPYDDQDEALCAYDYNTAGLILDDELRELFRLVPDGVNLTCFMDCCHSESNTRKKLDVNDRSAKALRRYMRLPDEARENFLRQHPQGTVRSRSRAVSPADGGREFLRAVNFTACRATQFAYEDGERGAYSKRALAILAKSGGSTFTHQQFLEQLEAAFKNSGFDQKPTLDCTDEAQSDELLQPLQ